MNTQYTGQPLPDCGGRGFLAPMLWSLVRRYTQLALNGQFTSDPVTGRPTFSITDVTPSSDCRG